MPYALIGWGGQQVGIRPRTRLAWLQGTKVFTWDGSAWIPCRDRRPESVTIYKEWQRWPSEKQVAAAKKALKPIVCQHPFVRLRDEKPYCYICGTTLTEEEACERAIP